VWVGFDEVRFLGSGETGSRAALPIWIDYMRGAIREMPADAFEVPGGDRIVFTRIDKDTGLLATHRTQKTVFQPFIAGTEPRRTADSALRDDRARRDLQQDSFEMDPGQSLDFDSF
jgi:penicillin-binding protein 1A